MDLVPEWPPGSGKRLELSMRLDKRFPGVEVSFLDVEAALIGPGESRSSGICVVLGFENIIVKTAQLHGN
jgi:hypothetical protein